MGATEELVRFVVQAEAGDLPDEVVHQAKRCFIDYLGVALNGSSMPIVDTLLEFSREEGGTPRATIIGRGVRASLMQAAFVNGCAGVLRGFEDSYFPTQLHPSAVMWPATYALAEERGLSGLQALTAYILGVEVAGRIALSVHPWHYDHGFRLTSTVGVFGAAAAASKLLDLSQQEFVHALGIAGNQASGLKATLGHSSSALDTGTAAAQGLRAAILAGKGLTGPQTILEHPSGFWAVFSPHHDASRITDGLGHRWQVQQMVLKAFPVGGPAQPFIDAVLQLRHQHHLRPQEIQTIQGQVHPDVMSLLASRPHPANSTEAVLSVHHAAAVALTDGTATLAQFTDQRVKDSAVAALRDLVQLEMDSSLAIDQVVVTITTKDGRTPQQRIEHMIGSPANPLSDTQLEEKYRGLAVPVLGQEQTSRLLEVAWHIDRLSNLAEITELLSPSRR